MSFDAIPAIDILDGKCVRLQKGDYGLATKYHDDPASVAARFAAVCNRIHVVDLDGAKNGTPSNPKAIAALIRSALEVNPNIQVEVGGGLRTMENITSILNLGASFVVLGTAAIRDRDFLSQACENQPNKVLLGLDARDGKVSVSGWTQDTELDAREFAMEAESCGIAGIIHTDINRDGMLSGPNVEATAELADTIKCPVIASGGIRSAADLKALSNTSVSGAIIGKALYAGSINLEDLSQVN